jgi:hypothetical protein
MKFAFLTLCVLGLTVGVNGQAGVSPAEASWKWTEGTVGPGTPHELPNGHVQMTNRLTAKNVEIRIGNSVITADVAEVGDWRGVTGPVDIALAGNVHVKTVLDHSR